MARPDNVGLGRTKKRREKERKCLPIVGKDNKHDDLKGRANPRLAM